MKTLHTFFLLILSATAPALDLESVYTAEELSQADESVLEDARLNFVSRKINTLGLGAHLGVNINRKTELAKKYGYPVELHTINTSDGYVLTVHRIPHGRKCGPGKPKIPVLVQHGLLCSSIDFIIMGPENGLGYILADECYDVWLSNSRGNRESRKHLSGNLIDQKFWDFSWHEMGVYDLPAVVDYVLNVSGQPSLHYIGHSQGTTQFFIFGALRPEYHSKIRSAHALSPVAFMKNLKSPIIKILSIFNKPLHDLAQLVGIYEFMPTSAFLNFMGMHLCRDQFPALQAVCANVVFLMVGFNPDQLNTTMLPAIIGHTPAGASTKQLIHYAQGILTDGFRKFDYGPQLNKKKYNSTVPPNYEVEKIDIPVAFYYSDNDWLADVNDIHRLSNFLPRFIGKFRVPYEKFNHADYLWAINVKKLVYDKLISIMKRY